MRAYVLLLQRTENPVNGLCVGLLVYYTCYKIIIRLRADLIDIMYISIVYNILLIFFLYIYSFSPKLNHNVWNNLEVIIIIRVRPTEIDYQLLLLLYNKRIYRYGKYRNSKKCSIKNSVIFRRSVKKISK